MFQTSDQAPLRGGSTPEKDFGFYDATIDGGWAVPGEPYVQPASDPHGPFTWWRSRMLGGRTNHWGRISLRNGPYDFKPHTRDGLGFDWPISYEDVAPYYDKVETADRRLRHLRGTGEHAEFRAGVSAAAAGAARQRLPGAAASPAAWVFPSLPVIARFLPSSSTYKRSPALLHPGNLKAQKIIAAAHAAARGLLLGHRLRPRLLDPGQLSIDHGASAAGAGDGQSRHRAPTRWSAK